MLLFSVVDGNKIQEYLQDTDADVENPTQKAKQEAQVYFYCTRYEDIIHILLQFWNFVGHLLSPEVTL